MVNNEVYAQAMKSLWVDSCTVKVKQDIVNDKGRTVQTEVTLFENQPCRLSFESVTVPTDTSSAAQEVQTTKLFIAKALDIPAGSKIIVTHEGITREYAKAGVSAPYTYHQQIPLELVEEWA